MTKTIEGAASNAAARIPEKRFFGYNILNILRPQPSGHSPRSSEVFDGMSLAASGKKGQACFARVQKDSQNAKLSMGEQERRAKKEMKAVAQEELGRLWMYRDPLMKQRAKDYFEMLKDPNWKLVNVKSCGTQVWRLPGEKIHRIMGVSDVAKPPKTCMEYFKDPHMMFRTLFPKVDHMFVKGNVLDADVRRGRATCQALFRLPNLVGSGAAPGFPPREMVWEQVTGFLPTGNVLIAVQSLDKERGSRIKQMPGSIRGEIVTSGYYGRAIDSSKQLKCNGPGHCSRVWYIVQADPAGILPKWLVNMAATKQADNVTRLRELFSK